MIKFIKKLFGISKGESPEIKSVTLGERDEDGYCDTYVNGKKTNVRMLVFTKEQVDRLHKIGEEIHKKNKKMD